MQVDGGITIAMPPDGQPIAEALGMIKPQWPRHCSFVTGTHIVVDGGITVGPRHAWDPTAPQPIAEALGMDQAAMAAAIAGSAGS
jgi:hypothetical protein